MAFVHGSNTVAALQIWPLQPGMRSLSLSMQKELSDVSSFGDDDRQFIESLRVGTVNMTGLYNRDDGAFGRTLDRGWRYDDQQRRWFSMAFVGVGSGPNALFMQLDPISWGQTSSLSDAVMVDGDFQVVAPIYMAHMLHNGPLATSGNGHTGAWVDLGDNDWDNKFLIVHPFVRPAGSSNTTLVLQESNDISVASPVISNKITLQINEDSDVLTHNTLTINTNIGRYVRMRGSTTRTMSILAFLHVSNNP